jgi:RNA polymerase sigma factor (sigma-70 family)
MLSSADEAEDAVQQTFISAYSSLRTDARDIRLKPWLYTIARNRCLSMLRARREQPAELDDVPTAGLADEVQQRSDLRELLADLRELPVEQRSALVLSEVGDLSHAEVGAIVGCEVAKVKSLVFQARSSLIETRKARDIPCQEIREQLATLTGGALRRAPLRRHIRACAGCAEFRDEVTRQRKAFAAVLPVVPTLGLKHSALAAIGLGGGGGGGAAAGGGIASLLSAGAGAKIAVVAVATGVAVGGGFILDRQSPAPAAEAAGGQQGSGGQAWPAPAAGTGPGTRAISAHGAAARHGATVVPLAAKRHGAGSSRHATSQPTAGHGAKQPRSHSQATPGGRHGGGHHTGAHPGTGQAAPAPSTPAPPASTPASPSSPSSDGQSHGHKGHHNGWTQGQGHQQHQQDVGGTHVPSGGGSSGGGSGDTSGGKSGGGQSGDSSQQSDSAHHHGPSSQGDVSGDGHPRELTAPVTPPVS